MKHLIEGVKILISRIILITILISFFSCSVKENRALCPVWIKLKYKGKESIKSPYSVNVIIKNVKEGEEKKERFREEERELNVKLAKGRIKIISFRNNIEDGIIIDEANNYVIRKGEDSKELYLNIIDKNIMEDFIEEEIRLSKNYSEITFEIREKRERKESPYYLKLKSDIVGLNLETGEALYGDFEYDMYFDEEQKTKVNLIRQEKNSLLKIYYIDKKTEEIEGEFDLGEYLFEIGYDWSKKDLEDIRVLIDISQMKIKVEIKGWEQGDNINKTF